MTSKPSSCFVYVTLPGQTEPVTAAPLRVDDEPNPLAAWCTGRATPQDAVPLEPLELPLLEQTFETTQLRGVLGALRDASPTSGAGASSSATPASQC